VREDLPHDGRIGEEGEQASRTLAEGTDEGASVPNTRRSSSAHVSCLTITGPRISRSLGRSGGARPGAVGCSGRLRLLSPEPPEAEFAPRSPRHDPDLVIDAQRIDALPATSEALQWTVANAMPSLDMAVLEGTPTDAAGMLSVHRAHVMRFEYR